MKKSLVITLFCAAFAVINLSFSLKRTTNLKWYTWEEAAALQQTQPRKIIVDVYTDWCGWCKKMDKGAFVDPEVEAYLLEHFYPVKLNAEQKEAIQFSGETFVYQADAGRRGVHTLAYALLNGAMSYPSLVYLNEKFERIMISPGYKEAPDLLKELKFTAEEHYINSTWEAFLSGQK